MAKICYLKSVLIFVASLNAALSQSCFNDCLQTVKQCSLCYQQCGSALTMISCANKQTLFNQRDCIENCCNDGERHSSFTISALNSCRPTDQSSKTTSLQSAGYYAIIAVGSIACVVLFVIVSREIYKRIKYSSGSSKRVIPENNQNSFFGLSQSQHGANSVNIKLQENADTKEFQFSRSNTADTIKIKEQANCCCICLQEKVNCVTKCGHFFHLKCLIQWTARRNACPLCNSKQTFQMKLYCQECHQQMGALDIRAIPKSQLQKISLRKCKTCRR